MFVGRFLISCSDILEEEIKCKGLSMVVQMMKHLPASGRPGFDSWVGKTP